jgi:hypothetical protein
LTEQTRLTKKCNNKILSQKMKRILWKKLFDRFRLAHVIMNKKCIDWKEDNIICLYILRLGAGCWTGLVCKTVIIFLIPFDDQICFKEILYCDYFLDCCKVILLANPNIHQYTNQKNLLCWRYFWLQSILLKYCDKVKKKV